ncbi:uncharacterized protein V6R79_019462 [Siganus canaliculatus]
MSQEEEEGVAGDAANVGEVIDLVGALVDFYLEQVNTDEDQLFFASLSMNQKTILQPELQPHLRSPLPGVTTENKFTTPLRSGGIFTT